MEALIVDVLNLPILAVYRELRGTVYGRRSDVLKNQNSKGKCTNGDSSFWVLHFSVETAACHWNYNIFSHYKQKRQVTKSQLKP